MKQKLLIICLLFISRICVATETNNGIFNQKESFQIAAAVKLGASADVGSLALQNETGGPSKTGCIEGSIPDGSGGCMKCPANASCSDGNFHCKAGYFKKTEKTCAACKEGCDACSDQNSCTSCKNGYYLSEGVCTICPKNGYCAGGAQSFVCNTNFYKTQNGKGCYRPRHGFEMAWFAEGEVNSVCALMSCVDCLGTSNSWCKANGKGGQHEWAVFMRAGRMEHYCVDGYYGFADPDDRPNYAFPHKSTQNYRDPNHSGPLRRTEATGYSISNSCSIDTSSYGPIQSTWTQSQLTAACIRTDRVPQDRWKLPGWNTNSTSSTECSW